MTAYRMNGESEKPHLCQVRCLIHHTIVHQARDDILPHLYSHTIASQDDLYQVEKVQNEEMEGGQLSSDCFICRLDEIWEHGMICPV